VNASWLSEERDAYVLGLLRVVFATLMFFLIVKEWREYQVDFFGESFHMSLLPESLVPSRAAYLALMGFQALCSVMAVLGPWARPALGLSALGGLYGMFGDRLHYHNNRYELLLLTLLVAMTPCDRSFLVIGKAQPGVAPRWAARLVGAQLSVVYLASSLGKLLDADWRSGVVLLPRFATARPFVEQHLFPGLMALVTAPWFSHAASLGAIASELFLALGPWLPRTRVLALWLGVMFHLGIELMAHVELFSYTMLGGYLVFVTPELRQRQASWNPRGSVGKVCAALCRRLDVLARFDQRAVSEQTELLVICDAEQRAHHGLSAWRELCRATPLLFPLWLPLRLVTWRERGDAG
jgi:Vitamin K-dependent gamma-carboxylase